MSFRLLSVHPHPDDESISCGGVLARYAAEGVSVHVVTCTGGEEGENLAGIDLGEDPLVTHRRRELAQALDRLGVSRHTYLGYRDSGMAGEPSNDHPESFHVADVDEAGGRLAEIIRTERPHVVISDGPDGTYGHPDHVKAYEVTARAVELAARPSERGESWQVPKRYFFTLSTQRMIAAHERLLREGLSSPFGDEPFDDPDELPFGTDEEVVTTRIEVGRWLSRKQAAIAAHRSQVSADSFFLNLPPDLADDTFGVEEFVLEAGPLGVEDGLEDDLFAGLGAGRDEGR